MNRIFLVLVVLATALLLASVPAAAVQVPPENNTSTTRSDTKSSNATPTVPTTPSVPDRNSSNGSDCSVVVDADTRICSGSFDASTGTSTIVIHSQTNQRVVLTDAGSFAKGGEVPRKRVFVEPGKNRISIQSQKYRGSVGVALSTDDTLYAYYINKDDSLIGGPWGRSDAQLAAIGAAIGAGVIVIFRGLRYAAKDESEPERVA